MREYFTSVFIVSLLIGFLEKFLYKEKGVFGEKAALAVILMFAVASPLPTLLSQDGVLPRFPDFSTGDVGEGEYEEVTKEAFEEGLRKQIADEFSISEEKITVRCINFSFKDMRAEKISVLLSLSAAGVDPQRVEKYVNGLGLGECEVQFEIR